MPLIDRLSGYKSLPRATRYSEFSRSESGFISQVCQKRSDSLRARAAVLKICTFVPLDFSPLRKVDDEHVRQRTGNDRGEEQDNKYLGKYIWHRHIPAVDESFRLLWRPKRLPENCLEGIVVRLLDLPRAASKALCIVLEIVAAQGCLLSISCCSVYINRVLTCWVDNLLFLQKLCYSSFSVSTSSGQEPLAIGQFNLSTREERPITHCELKSRPCASAFFH